MKKYIVTERPLFLRMGIIELTDEQYNARKHNLKPLKKKRQYEITGEICFKIGEKIGLEPVLRKDIGLEPVEAKPKSKPKAKPKPEKSNKADDKVKDGSENTSEGTTDANIIGPDDPKNTMAEGETNTNDPENSDSV